MSTLTLIKTGIGALLLALGVWLVHDNGRELERGECLERESKAISEKHKELVETQALLEQARQDHARLAAENLRLNDEVTANAAKEMESARVADAALRRDPHGLRISAEACRDATARVPTTASSAELDHGRGSASGIRLPAGIEADLYDLTHRANQTRIKRDECREWAIGLARQREEWESARAERRLIDGDSE